MAGGDGVYLRSVRDASGADPQRLNLLESKFLLDPTVMDSGGRSLLIRFLWRRKASLVTSDTTPTQENWQPCSMVLVLNFIVRLDLVVIKFVFANALVGDLVPEDLPRYQFNVFVFIHRYR